MYIISELANSADTPFVTLLIGIVVAFASVIIYMYKHTQNKTVPKFIWKRLVDKIVVKIKEISDDVDAIARKLDQIETKIDERK